MNEIMKKLRSNIEEMKTIFDSDNIFCIYAYGKVNSEENVELSNVKTEIIYIPTFEELCFEKPEVKKEYFNGEEILIRDIRDLFSVNENNLHCVELLYTDYYLINPKYELIFKNIILSNRREIMSYTRILRLIYGARLGIQYLDENNIDRARKIYSYCENLNLKFDGMNCYELVENDLTKEQLRFNFENFLFVSQKKCCCDEILEVKNAMLDIIKNSILKENNVDKFINDLTVGELTALKAVIKESEEDGLINISKLSEETGISRQLFSTLFSKLKTGNFATIRNMGMKGTQIKFINSDIIEKI